jgi:hypothetical protein
MRKFVRKYRKEIDAVIRANGGNIFNDKEREDWVMNDEGLYNWARSEGVKI